ncbi:hypothetical protein ACFC1T_17995 [Kitasatospora sp. NPDC056076]|uniref:hypothetical protein n=1 Tax=Kitasatospora sp. NPDC056076 TaxID=3345703 RepID=UPI0035DDEE7C
MSTSGDAPEDDYAPSDSALRERAGKEGRTPAPTPKDVRAKADGDDEAPEPPAADTQAP